MLTLPQVVPQRRIATKPALHRVKLFDHLYMEKMSFNIPINKIEIHKEVTKLGIQYANNIIVGSNARCIAFLKAMKMVRKYF
jgi:translation initiation factor eIF-2B subunit delta